MAKKIPSIVKEIRNHQTEAINYGYQKGVSYSQFSMYNQCPRKWELQYKEGHKVVEQSIHMTFGTAIHETLQHYFDVMYNESIIKADEIDLESHFEGAFREEYKKGYTKNKEQHFSNPKQLREFFEDGLAILEYFKKNKKKYFSKRGWHLVGCEIPILLPATSKFKNVLFNGFIDVVLYHEPTNTFKIIDIKTSTRGWKDKDKKDEMKQLQLVLYKTFFNKQFGVSLENIEIEFFIVKRKIWEESEFAISRIQLFTPASGKVKMNKANKLLNEFVDNCFEHKGFKDKNHKPKINDYCKYCPFYKTHLCSATFQE